MDFFPYLSDKKSVSIIVRPRAPETKIMKWDTEKNALRVDVAAPPEDNKANREIIKFFSKLTKKKVTILTGLTSKKKVLNFV